VVTPYPNVLYAFDLTQDGYPLKWKYRPNVDAAAMGIACCDVVNRGAFFADGKIVYNLLDGHTVAIDAATGREVWSTPVADVRQGESTPMAPLVVRDRVIVGTAGGEFGVRGWVKGLDLATGRVLWTGYNAGPDAELLAQPGTFRPFYDKGPDLGQTTWPPDGWKHGGAPVWGWLSYDPVLDLFYYGTGNPAPYNADQRPGDNKWATSVLARRPGDGTLVWAYQFTPADNWDYDAVQEMILADVTVTGRRRKVLVHFDKNGFAYTIDRATGEVLVAEPYVVVNWAKRVDLTTGRPEVDPTKLTGASHGSVKDICPTLEGGKNQQPAAYSPHRPVLRSHQQHVHGLPDDARHLPHRDAVHRLERPLQAGPGREPGRADRVGRGSREKDLGDQGEVSRLERRPRHRRRRCVLRYARRLVQGRRCEQRPRAVEIQSGVRGRRQPDHIHRPRRQAIRGRVRGHRR